MNYSVIGMGYGDEGKGSVVDYLCSQHDPEEIIVVRHSGGHQVGHTVKNGDFFHEFRHFGSGSSRNVPTFWSKNCTVNPSMFRYERDLLLTKGCFPQLFVEAECPIATPFDVAFNRAINKSKGVMDSVGVGFAATLKRHQLVPLYVIDLPFKQIFNRKLDNIHNYYKGICNELGIGIGYKQALKDLEKDIEPFTFLEDCQYFYNYIVTVTTRNRVYASKHVIFEGNQGILLDKNHGCYPHVTYGTTTNATVRDWGLPYETYYVTRAYSTRHGDGPLDYDDYEFDLINTEFESNHLNEFQGHFRKAPLNIDLLSYATIIDRLYRFPYIPNIVVTCADQIDIKNAPFIIDGELCENGDILYHIKDSIKCNLFVNQSPESKTIKAYNL